MDDETLIFVYGTLRHEYARLPRAARRVEAPSALHARGALRGRATLRGYALFDAGDYPAAAPRARAAVAGDVFAVRAADARGVLAALDRFEGFGAPFAPPFEFVRARVRVRLRLRRAAADVHAWAYVYNWPLRALPLIAGGDYVAHCLAALTSPTPPPPPPPLPPPPPSPPSPPTP